MSSLEATGSPDRVAARAWTVDWTWTAMVLGVCAVILAPTLTFRMGTDQGVFAYMAAELLEGRWPYLHTWESDFPGLVFIQALEIWLLGKSIVMFRVFDLIVQLANAYLVYRIAWRVGSRWGGYVAAATFSLIYQGYGPWNTAQREGFGLLFLLLGFWFYLTRERRPLWITAMGVGLGLGVAVTIKPTLLALGAFYAPLLFYLKRREAWGIALAVLAGVVAPMGAILIFYWSQGGLLQLYEACVGYQSIYTMRLRGDAPLLWYWLGKVQRLGGHSVMLLILYAPFLLRGPARRERLMLFLGYLGSVYAVFVQGTFAGYHYLPGLGMGAILIGSMFAQTGVAVFGDGGVRVGRARIATQCLVAHLIILAALPVYWQRGSIEKLLTLRFLDRPLPGEYRNGAVFDFTEGFEIAEYLRAHTEPGDRVQVWGYESLVYYLAERSAASRFQTTHPLVMRVPGQDLTPMQKRWRIEFVRHLRERRPKFVAVVQGDNWWWAPEERTSEDLLTDFGELKKFLEVNYVVEGKIGRFRVYRYASLGSRLEAVRSDGDG